MVVQDLALRAGHIQKEIDRTNISYKCRRCAVKGETNNSIDSECPALAQKQHKKRHDTEAGVLDLNLCKKYHMICSISCLHTNLGK